MLKKTKAQAGNQAAILVIIITVLLVLFILSIPLEERDKLLDNGQNNNDNQDSTFPDSITLIRANPGKIEYVSENEKIHEFAAFNINADTKGELIFNKNSIYLKTSAFEKITDTITFRTNLETTDNVLLNFNIETASGSINIKLNGETIYNAPMQQGNSPPISISKNMLKPENILEMQVSGPGAAFWRYNEYSLKNINIYADVLDLTKSKATQVFNVDKKEADKLETSTLRYVPFCYSQQIRDLSIQINDFTIFTGTPDCEVFNTIPIPTHYLHEGINEITFQIKEGRTLIEQPRITNNIEKPDTTTYYFQMQDKYFNFEEDEYIMKNEYESMLDITFPDNTQKRFELIINGKLTNFNTARLRETRNMQVFLQPGTNSIQIKPQTELTITEIRIRIREK